jgi:hypothetical protein
MKTLRDASIKKIYAILDQSFFTRHAFEATFNGEYGDILSLTFKQEPLFQFKISQPGPGGTWKTTECPGETFSEAETTNHTDYSKCQARINAWIQRVVEEIAIHKKPQDTDFSNLRASLEQGADDLPDPDSPFSDKESGEWADRLDQMITRFEELKEANEIQQRELNALNKEVSHLKNQLAVLPKRTWVKAAGNKILNIFERFANTKAGQAVLEKAVKILIGHDGA